jgi:Cytochrome c554 and c-prime
MSKVVSIKTLIKILLVACALSAPLLGRFTIARQSPKSFSPSPDWRPTFEQAGVRYLGNASCAECHTHGERQAATPMALALETAVESRILNRYERLTFQSGRFSYVIKREGRQSIYTVSDGAESISVPILYAFGQGKAGQTYIFARNGSYHESRVSFYNAINGLDYTLGAPREPARSLEEALGRRMEQADAKDCFSCHATGASSESKLQPERLTPGITCEGCHGGGQPHVALMKSLAGKSKPADMKILNPARFDTEGETQFCGACHRTWAQVQLLRVQGVANVRFQPYRIFNSKCYDLDDRRIRCSACHNPHESLRRDAAHYDTKCLACHQLVSPTSVQNDRAPICKAGKRQNCASCHMPEYEIPGSHSKFTDHFIRVVRAQDGYPN